MKEADIYSKDYLGKRSFEASEAQKALRQFQVQKANAEFDTVSPQKPLPRVLEQNTGKKENDDKRNVAADVALQAVGGVRDAVQETMDGADSLGDWLNANVVDLGAVQITNPDTGEFDLDFISGKEKVEKNLQGLRIPEVDEADTMSGALTRGVSQFLTGFMPMLKALKFGTAATKAVKVKKAVSAAAITDFTVFDPHAERLSNFTQSFPELRNPVSKFLAASPGDTELEGRFKNVLEGLGLDAITAGAFTASVKAVRGAKMLRNKSIKEVAEEGGEAFGLGDIKNIEEVEKPAGNLYGNPNAPKISQVSNAAIKKTKSLPEPSQQKTENLFNLQVQDQDKAININLARIDTSDDIKSLIAKTSVIFESEIKAATRSVQPNKVTEQLADELGMSVGELLQRRKGDAFNAEHAVAARKILVSSADNLKQMAQKTQLPDATDADRIRLRRGVAIHAAIQQQVSGLTAEAGRALQSFKILSTSQREQAKAISDALTTTGGRGTAEEMAKAILEADNIRIINRLTRNVHQASNFDMVLEGWMNSILSGPTTHVVNMSSNLSNALLGIPERALAGVYGKIFGSQNAVRVGEVQAQSYGFLLGIRDGWAMAKHAFKTEGLEDPLTKLEGLDRRAITSGNLSKTFVGRNVVDPAMRALNAKTLSEGGYAARMVDGLGTAIRFSGFRMLSSEDAFFKGLNYRMELHAQSYRQASNEGLRGKEFGARVNEIINDPPESIRLKSMEQAEVNTFTNPNEIAQGINKFTTKLPYTKFVLPFVRTPTNIIKFGFERSPFALLSNRIRGDIAAGGARRDLALSKVTIGSSAMAYASSLSLEGKITGSAPKDPNLRKIWLQENQEYSFKIKGDDGKTTFISYNRFEPVGMLFGISADFAQMAEGLEEKEADELAAMAALAFSNNVISKTWLSGVSNALEAINNPERKSGRLIRNTLAGFAPNLLSQTNRAFVDPYLRELDSVADAFKARIPGLSDDLPARRNLWGEPIEPRTNFTDDLGEQTITLLSPAYVKQVDGDAVNEMLIDNEISIKMPTRNIKVPGMANAVPLKAEEYSRYVELAGKPAKTELDRIIKSGRFADMSGGSDGAKSLVVREIISKLRARARNELLEEFPDIIDRGMLLQEKQAAGQLQ